MPERTFQQAFSEGQFGNFPGLKQEDQKFTAATPKQLQSLGVDTAALDAEVDTEIEIQKANTLSRDDFIGDIKKIQEGKNLDFDTAYDDVLNYYKAKGLTVDGIDIDKELGNTFENFTEPEEDGLGEGISDIGKSIKFKGTEELSLSEAPFDIGKTLLNLPGDTVEAMGDFIELVTNPIDTVKSIGELFLSLQEKAMGIGSRASADTFDFTEEQKEKLRTPFAREQIADALGEQIKENFGTPGKAKKTITENPVDTFMFLKGALNTVGKVSNSKKLIDISNKIDPLKMQTVPAWITTKITKNLLTSTQGKLTGLGKEGVEDIITLGKTDEFGEAFRGNISTDNVVNDVTSAIKYIKTQASNKLGDDLDKILKQGNVKVNFETQISDFFTGLSDKGVIVTRGKNGKYTVKEGPNTELIEEDLAIITDIVKRVNNKSGELTGIEARAFMNRMGAEASKLQDKGILINFRKSLTEGIEQASPGFKKMNQDYKKMTDTVKNLEDTFGSPNTRIETKINKLNMALRDNQDYKKFMLSIIEESSGKNIKGKLAGLAAKEMLPRGLMGQIGAGGAIGSLFAGAGLLKVFGILAISSPRLLGEVSRALGISLEKLKDSVNIINNNLPGQLKSVPIVEPLRTGVKGAGITEDVLNNTNEEQNGRN